MMLTVRACLIWISSTQKPRDGLHSSQLASAPMFWSDAGWCLRLLSAQAGHPAL